MQYSIHTDVKFGPLELVDAGRLADECREAWWNQTLCRVRGVVHRTRALERTVALMVEPATVVATGD